VTKVITTSFNNRNIAINYLIMKTVQIYDPAMCCSSGVCGSSVDETLVHFSANLKWLSEQGVQVERFNLGKESRKFMEHPQLYALLQKNGSEVLPVIIVDGEIVSSGHYPTKYELAQWAAVVDIPVN
jgi:disulfide oxidoreductase YuzD